MGKVHEILIADDHALIRKGLCQLLDKEPNFKIHEADNGEDALKIIRKQQVEVAVLDIEMPQMTGFEVAKKAHNESIKIDIIFLTMFKDESMFNKAMDIGVKGYILKENKMAEILKCIQAVLSGKYYLSPDISEFLIRRNNRMSNPAADKDGIHLLTPAEKNILKMLATMKTNQEMANELGISIKTVQNHRNNICNKLDISGSHALLKFAVVHDSIL
ncbi:MAG: response regulator transcription factor [Balneolaceae bacterium]